MESTTIPRDAEVRVSNTLYAKYVKRIIDVIISFIGILILWPIMLVVAVLVVFDVGPPIIFKMQRPGKNCKLFYIYKFHDLNNKTDENEILLPARERTTKIGRFLRSSSLDELPQLFNILKGEMSIIGPRPLLKEYISYYDSRQIMRHAVRPGLECPSLVERNHSRSWEEQFEDDVWYVENISFFVDCKMILQLIKMVFGGKEKKRRAGANREFFGSMTREEKITINQSYSK